MRAHNDFFYPDRFGTLTAVPAQFELFGVNTLIVGGIYRHYKGRRYRIVTLALIEATREEVVVYECLYPNDVGQVWVRPVPDFTATVESAGYRGPRFAPDPAGAAVT